jgi:hypothetical protein
MFRMKVAGGVPLRIFGEITDRVYVDDLLVTPIHVGIGAEFEINAGWVSSFAPE